MSSKDIRRVSSGPVDDNRIHYAKGCGSDGPAARETQISSSLARLADVASRLREKCQHLGSRLQPILSDVGPENVGDAIKDSADVCGMAAQIREIEDIVRSSETAIDSISNRIEL